MQGKVIKGVGGLYFVDCYEEGMYQCRARGVFRKEGISPLVGDNVVVEVTDPVKHDGSLAEILPRKNQLIRPASANIDQALVVFAAAKPDPNFNLLDRFLVMMKKQNIDTVVCFNKTDIVDKKEIDIIADTYRRCGHKILFASVREDNGIDSILQILEGKTTVLAGPSGVGKSSLMNRLQPKANMETGSISEKIERGKQTTRHTELIRIAEGTFLMDTPGFSSLYVTDMQKEDLQNYFVEFDDYINKCKFIGCSHIKEPVCGVKDALTEGLISKNRYNNYCLMYEELAKQSRNR